MSTENSHAAEPHIESALENVFRERSDFLIIGLTGRTGSGCTTTADILSSSEPFLVQFPRPTDLTDRDYTICNKYLSKNWSRFVLIRVRDVITSYFCDYPFSELRAFCSDTLSISLQEIETALSDVEPEFDRLFTLRKEIAALPDTTRVDRLIKAERSNQFYSDVQRISNTLKGKLDGLASQSFIKIYQIVGNNLRLSGHPYENRYSATKFHTVAKRVNQRIKSIRMTQSANGQPTRIVIDAFRNPFEINYFRTGR